MGSWLEEKKEGEEGEKEGLLPSIGSLIKLHGWGWLGKKSGARKWIQVFYGMDSTIGAITCFLPGRKSNELTVGIKSSPIEMELGMSTSIFNC